MRISSNQILNVVGPDTMLMILEYEVVVGVVFSCNYDENMQKFNLLLRGRNNSRLLNDLNFKKFNRW